MHVEIKLNPDLDVWYIEGDSSYYWWDDKLCGLRSSQSTVKKVSPKKVRIVKRKNRAT